MVAHLQIYNSKYVAAANRVELSHFKKKKQAKSFPARAAEQS